MTSRERQSALFGRATSWFACVAIVLTALAACADQDQQPQGLTTINTPSPTPSAVIQAPPTPTTEEPDPATVELTVDDGYIPDGELLSPFDTAHPAIANLEANLRAAIQLAALDAAEAGVEFYITSGWRSERYQRQLLNEGIALYGSEEEARKWVNTPEQSSHVPGNAVDIGPVDAYSWLSQHGEAYGLCQIYANEMWHYELATEPGGSCPLQRTDASASR